MPTQYDIAKLNHCYELAKRFGLAIKDDGEKWLIFRVLDNGKLAYVASADLLDRLQKTLYRLSETTPGDARSPAPPKYDGPERRKK